MSERRHLPPATRFGSGGVATRKPSPTGQKHAPPALAPSKPLPNPAPALLQPKGQPGTGQGHHRHHAPPPLASMRILHGALPVQTKLAGRTDSGLTVRKPDVARWSPPAQSCCSGSVSVARPLVNRVRRAIVQKMEEEGAGHIARSVIARRQDIEAMGSRRRDLGQIFGNKYFEGMTEEELDDDKPYSQLEFSGKNIEAGILGAFKTVLAFEALFRTPTSIDWETFAGGEQTNTSVHAEVNMIAQVEGAIPADATRIIVNVTINNSPCANCTRKLESFAQKWCAGGRGRNIEIFMNYDLFYKSAAKDAETRYHGLRHLHLDAGIELDEADTMEKMSSYHQQVVANKGKKKGKTLDQRMSSVFSKMESQGFAMEEFGSGSDEDI